MAPIYDSDVAHERWKKDQWRTFELWEKVEKRLRGRKKLLVGLAIILFLLLCSVPVFLEASPRWNSRRAVREIGQVIGHMKRDAALTSKVLEFIMVGEGFKYEIHEKKSCAETTPGTLVSSAQLTASPDGLKVLSVWDAKALGLLSIADRFCFDPMKGASYPGDRQRIAFAVAPASDLTLSDINRAGVIILSGNTAEISFD